MVANLASAERLAFIGAEERAALADRARPIVLAPGRGALAPSVAPNLRDVGLMLAYTPLHWLLCMRSRAPDFATWRDAPNDLALVATSANLAGAPLIASDDDARQRLEGVADLIVTHGRAIVVRADDSVMRIIDGAPVLLRRARGFVPDPIDLGREGPSVIAPARSQEHGHASRAAARPSSRSTSAISTTARRCAFAPRPSGT